MASDEKISSGWPTYSVFLQDRVLKSKVNSTWFDWAQNPTSESKEDGRGWAEASHGLRSWKSTVSASALNPRARVIL